MSYSLKAQCTINLGYPYHRVVSAADTLSQIHAFIENKQNLGEVSLEHGIAELESQLTEILGFEAASWFPTGVLAQGVAARIHGEQVGNGQLVLHPTSHLLLHEQDSFFHAHGCSAKVVGQWREPLCKADLNDAVGTVFIEMPQRHSGGKLPTWDALQEIKAYCQKESLPLHMDGARLWSSRAFYSDKSYAEIVNGFDSVYLSLYKDIGAIGGAILAGKRDFIEEAKIWRTRFGGLSVGSWPLVYDGLRLLDKRIGQMPQFIGKANELAQAIVNMPGLVVDPSTPHSNLFHVLLPVTVKQAEKARDTLAQSQGVWLSDRFWGYESDHQCAMEIVVGEKALAINKHDFAKAVQGLLDYINTP